MKIIDVIPPTPVTLFTLIGHLESGQAVYLGANKTLAVEHGFKYLANPTPEQLAEIITVFPNLKPS